MRYTEFTPTERESRLLYQMGGGNPEVTAPQTPETTERPTESVETTTIETPKEVQQAVGTAVAEANSTITMAETELGKTEQSVPEGQRAVWEDPEVGVAREAALAAAKPESVQPTSETVTATAKGSTEAPTPETPENPENNIDVTNPKSVESCLNNRFDTGFGGQYQGVTISCDNQERIEGSSEYTIRAGDPATEETLQTLARHAEKHGLNPSIENGELHISINGYDGLNTGFTGPNFEAQRAETQAAAEQPGKLEQPTKPSRPPVPEQASPTPSPEHVAAAPAQETGTQAAPQTTEGAALTASTGNRNTENVPQSTVSTSEIAPTSGPRRPESRTTPHEQENGRTETGPELEAASRLAHDLIDRANAGQEVAKGQIDQLQALVEQRLQNMLPKGTLDTIDGSFRLNRPRERGEVVNESEQIRRILDFWRKNSRQADREVAEGALRMMGVDVDNPRTDLARDGTLAMLPPEQRDLGRLAGLRQILDGAQDMTENNPMASRIAEATERVKKEMGGKPIDQLRTEKNARIVSIKDQIAKAKDTEKPKLQEELQKLEDDLVALDRLQDRQRGEDILTRNGAVERSTGVRLVTIGRIQTVFRYNDARGAWQWRDIDVRVDAAWIDVPTRPYVSGMPDGEQMNGVAMELANIRPGTGTDSTPTPGSGEKPQSTVSTTETVPAERQSNAPRKNPERTSLESEIADLKAEREKLKADWKQAVEKGYNELHKNNDEGFKKLEDIANKTGELDKKIAAKEAELQALDAKEKLPEDVDQLIAWRRLLDKELAECTDPRDIKELLTLKKKIDEVNSKLVGKRDSFDNEIKQTDPSQMEKLRKLKAKIEEINALLPAHEASPLPTQAAPNQNENKIDSAKVLEQLQTMLRSNDPINVRLRNAFSSLTDPSGKLHIKVDFGALNNLAKERGGERKRAQQILKAIDTGTLFPIKYTDTKIAESKSMNAEEVKRFMDDFKRAVV